MFSSAYLATKFTEPLERAIHTAGRKIELNLDNSPCDGKAQCSSKGSTYEGIISMGQSIPFNSTNLIDFNVYVPFDIIEGM